MALIVSSLLTLLTIRVAPAQQRYGEFRVFVYASKIDSINQIEARQLIDKLSSKKPVNSKKIDSLHSEISKIFDRGHLRTYFRPSQEFMSVDSIKKTTDLSDITKLAVFRKSEMPSIIYQCRNLREIELIECSFPQLPTFEQCKSLSALYIYHPVTEKPLRFSSNSSVTKLILRVKSPRDIPRSFAPLRNLELLDLSDNSLVEFPNGARKNKYLKELGVQRNQLRLTGRIKKHKQLQRLAFHDNLIDYVPARIRKFPNLRKLNFNNNKITRVHPALGKLSKLEQLSFYHNKLTEVPAGAYQLRNLVEIDLFRNEIESINERIANWQRLETLYLSHNRLTVLPANIDTLRALTGLYAWDNRLGELPLTTWKLSKLRFLRVNNNYLKTFDPRLLSLVNLEELDLSHNYIATIPERIFDLPQLKILALVNNPWNDSTKAFLFKRGDELRAKDVYVHLSDKD